MGDGRAGQGELKRAGIGVNGVPGFISIEGGTDGGSRNAWVFTRLCILGEGKGGCWEKVIQAARMVDASHEILISR